MPLLTCVVAAGNARGQDDNSAYSSNHPLRLRGQASAMVLIEAWPASVRLHRAVARSRPDDGDVRYFLGVSLARAGELDAAREALRDAATIPAVCAHAWFELACLEGAAGQAEAAAEALGRAVDNGFYRSTSSVRGLRAFRAVRGNKELARQIKRVLPAPDRILQLADAGDHEGLVAVARAVAHLLDSTDAPTVLGLLRDLLLEHATARNDQEKSLAAAHAKAWAAAADEALGNDAFSTFATRGVAWSKKDAEATEKGLKKISALGNKVRAHRFTAVIEGDRKLEAQARKIGDPLLLIYSLAQRGLAHQSQLIEGGKRMTAGGGPDWTNGEACFSELRMLTERYGELDLRDNALGGLAQLHAIRAESTLGNVEDHAWEAILMRPKLPYGQRGLGFYENLIVDKRRAR